MKGVLDFRDGNSVTAFVGKKSEFSSVDAFLSACQSEFDYEIEKLGVTILPEHVVDGVYCRYYSKMPEDVSYLELESGYLFCDKGKGAFEVYCVSLRDLKKPVSAEETA